MGTLINNIMVLNKQNITIITSFVMIAAFLGFSIPAHANPLRFPPAQSTSSATTSPAFITTATATTTLATYDTYSNTGAVGGSGSTQSMDKIAILVQHTASTSAGNAVLTVEHSMDGIDWYGDELIISATITAPNITVPITYTLNGNAVSSTTNRIIQSSAPVRFVRVRATVNGANGALWVSIQPQKQNP